MWDFLKWVFGVKPSKWEAELAHAEARAYSDMLILEFEKEVSDIRSRHDERKRKELAEQLRIECMFMREKMGLVSDEEFSKFILE